MSFSNIANEGEFIPLALFLSQLFFFFFKYNTSASLSEDTDDILGPWGPHETTA